MQHSNVTQTNKKQSNEILNFALNKLNTLKISSQQIAIDDRISNFRYMETSVIGKENIKVIPPVLIPF